MLSPSITKSRGIQKGAGADFLIARAETVEDLIGSPKRTVMIEARVVASTTTQRH